MILFMRVMVIVDEVGIIVLSIDNTTFLISLCYLVIYLLISIDYLICLIYLYIYIYIIINYCINTNNFNI